MESTSAMVWGCSCMSTMASDSGSAWDTGPRTSSGGGGGTTPSKARRAASEPRARVATSREQVVASSRVAAHELHGVHEGAERLGEGGRLHGAQPLGSGGHAADLALAELAEDAGGHVGAEPEQDGGGAQRALAPVVHAAASELPASSQPWWSPSLESSCIQALRIRAARFGVLSASALARSRMAAPGSTGSEGRGAMGGGGMDPRPRSARPPRAGRRSRPAPGGGQPGPCRRERPAEPEQAEHDGQEARRAPADPGPLPGGRRGGGGRLAAARTRLRPERAKGALEMSSSSPRAASKPTARRASSPSRATSASGRGLPPTPSTSTATESRLRRGTRCRWSGGACETS